MRNFSVIMGLILFSTVVYCKNTQVSLDNHLVENTIAFTELNSQLHFPKQLSDLIYITHEHYIADHPELGEKIIYRKLINHEVVLEAQVSVYHLNHIPINIKTTREQLDYTERELYALQSSSNYKNVQKIRQQPTEIKVGQQKFQYAMLTFLKAGQDSYYQIVRELFITEYHQQWLKIQIDTMVDNQQNSVDNFIREIEYLLTH